jgi:FkbM family methyltransferase
MDRSLTPTSNAIDVGAHKGSILREILRRAPGGRHFAFEPLPHFYEGLVRDFPGVTVSPLALSDRKGRTTFQHAVADPAYSGLRKRTYPKGVQESLTEILVETDRLDAVLPDGLPIAFIKIDVEGAELEVLRGAEKTLRASRPLVVFEHGLGAADYYGTTPQAVYDLFAECGLQVSLLAEWLRGRRPLTRDGFAGEFTPRGHFYFLAHP